MAASDRSRWKHRHKPGEGGLGATGEEPIQAVDVTYGGATGISATNVEAALDELAAEKADLSAVIATGSAAGGVLSGTYPNPGFAVDMATQAELDAHHHDSAYVNVAGDTMTGALLFTDNGVDIGATGTGGRVRNVYVGTALFVGNTAGNNASLNASTFNVSGQAGFFGTGTSHDIYLMTAGTARWQVTPAGHMTAQTGGYTFSAGSKIYPGTPAAALQSACGIYAGTGAPNNANGANGDIYFRSDGGALTTIYQRRAGVWVGIG